MPGGQAGVAMTANLAGPVELKVRGLASHEVARGLIAALFWNGIVSVFVVPNN